MKTISNASVLSVVCTESPHMQKCPREVNTCANSTLVLTSSYTLVMSFDLLRSFGALARIGFL